MPRIANPVDRAERRINMALQRLDAALRRDAADCKDNDGKPGEWDRFVEVAMHGPGYLSLVIHDNTNCGGAHPNSDASAIVYDLKTGAPVDWARLLPPALIGKRRDDGLLSSKRLYDLYVAGYHIGNGKDDNPPDCKEPITEAGADGPPLMDAWLDAKAGGLAVSFELPHAVEGVCGSPVVIPVATLRAEGVQPVLLNALDAAAKPK